MKDSEYLPNEEINEEINDVGREESEINSIVTQDKDLQGIRKMGSLINKVVRAPTLEPAQSYPRQGAFDHEYADS